MKKIYFLLFSLLLSGLMFGQTIAFQDFEGGSDDWSYTATPANFNGGGDTWDIVSSLSSIQPQSGSKFWGVRDLQNGNNTSGDGTLDFADVNISGQTNVVVSFYYYTIGLDQSDSLTVEVFFDGTSQGVENLPKDSQAWVQYSKPVPDGTNNVRLKIFVHQNGGSDYIGLDNFRVETGVTASPSLVITSPTDGYTFNPETTNVSVEFTVSNFDIPNDGSIEYTVNGGTAQNHNSTSAIDIPVSAGNTYQVALQLVDTNGDPLNPAVTDTVNFSVATYTQVATLADLRAQPEHAYYEVTGEVFVTYGEDYTHNTKIFVQDNTAGIEIYDNHNIMTYANHGQGSGLTGLKGYLTSYRGMLEIKPTVDIANSSTGNTVTPQVVNLADFINNIDDYESELIKVTGATVSAQGNTFQYGENDTIIQSGNQAILRVMFHSLDGVSVPTGTVDVTAIAGEYSGHAQVYPRDANDFTTTQAIAESAVPGLTVYPNPATGDNLFITTKSGKAVNIRIYDLAGKEIMAAHLDGNGRLNIAPLHTGIYLMRIEQAGAAATIKLVRK